MGGSRYKDTIQLLAGNENGDGARTIEAGHSTNNEGDNGTAIWRINP